MELVSGTTKTYHETITDAINAAVDGDIINLGAITYAEQLVIDKSITLRGPNYQKTGFAQDRGPEAVITYPDGITAEALLLVHVDADDVTIEGLKFQSVDGYPGKFSTLIHTYSSNNFVVRNNVLNGTEVGIYRNPYNTSYTYADNTGWLIEGNLIDGGRYVNSQVGRGMYIYRTGATVRNNHIINHNAGIQILPAMAVEGGVVENNIVSAGQLGLYHNGAEKGSGAWTYKNNTVTIAPNDRSAQDVVYPYTVDMNVDFRAMQVINQGLGTTGALPSVTFESNTADLTKPEGSLLRDTIAVRVNESNPLNVENPIVFKENNFTNYTIAVKNSTANVPNVSLNYWGSETGPTAYLYGPFTLTSYYSDAARNNLVDATAPVLNYSGNVNVPGGIHIWLPNTQVNLAADTVIQNESPCFVIHADGVKIDAELGAKCIPTNGSDGIYIDDGLSGIRVSGLEIDGSGQTSNHGIHVDGVITNYVFISNRIHDLGGDGIHFAAQPGVSTVVDISGNLFYANTGVGVNNPAGTANVIAQFNAWGDPAGPTGPAGDGVGANVDSSNFTHVDLSLASSGPVWTDQVVRGPHTLHMKGRPIVLKDGNTYHMWAGLNDTTLIHYESTDPTFADAGAGTETTYNDKPIEVGSIAVVKEGDVFYMIAYGSTDQVFNIYTSSDGNSWLNKGLIFNSASKEGLSGGKVDAPSIILDGTGSKIYFQYGKPVRNIYMISTTQTLSAIADGDNDEDYTFDTTINPVLRPTEEGLASTMLFHPWVVKDGTKYYMYYTAYSPNVPTFRARMATSNDGEVWTFHSPNPVMQATSAEPSVFKDGDTWRMYFLGNGSKVGYVSGKGPAAFNETITYSVKANLTNVNGAEFTLTYPENLVYIGAAGDGNFTFEEVSHNSDTRTITLKAVQFNTMVSGTGMDILKVNFAGKTAGTDLPMDLGFNLAGGFTTNSPGSSQIVFPMGLVDGKVTVFDLPTITSTYADDYYLIGDAQDFEVTVTNTTGTFATTELRLTIPAGLTLTLNDPNYSLVGSTVNLGELAANETITLTFTATFSTISTDPLRFDLYDTAVDPDFELAAVSSIATVYTKPTITTGGLTGNHLGLDVPFTVTIGNLSDMTPVTFILDLGFPDGTVVSYGGTDYPCDASGCQIPVTLTVPTTELDFTATFPGAYDGDVVVTLYDSLADPDRPLATETVTSVVVVPNAGTITGTITMQGRTSHAGAVMILTPPAGAPYGPYQATSTDAIGINIQFTNVAGATYTITTNTPRYLNVPATLNKTIDVMVKQNIAPLRLISGNAVYTDNVINISDSGLIGTQYGNTGPQWDGDVNFDGVVNIRDLALVGGNYLLTSEGTSSVYNSWLP